MKPETHASLVRAQQDLDEAHILAAVPLARAAARSAYYATFHAAEAFIVEHTGKIAKTHRGVQSEFSRLTKHHAASDRHLYRALTAGFHYKELADDSIDPEAIVTNENAGTMIDDAKRFVGRVADLLGGSSAPADS